ncbi:glutamate mutase L [Ornithinimicrobium pratense]|uniref:Glutamate mutase n=1 Tax=Ornithinimicrobium pratense TaxID=2593973 RepID=A0A5J6V1R5_9MICO|nr:glutamate mutase L [Ornithinimicrobium pratense]QFG67770.1 glutamate mutase [Ornithinimicrobium pratense]
MPAPPVAPARSGTTLLVDVGSTFTKAALIDDEGSLLARAAVPTTVGPGRDVLDGLVQVADELGSGTRAQVPDPLGGDRDRVLVCSSAGGGLRLAVVGYERQVTAEAGHRVGLSAGAKVVHVASGPLSVADVASLRAARPDVVLLVGGTDGGNAEVFLHNARRLARSRVGAPVVVAGNAQAQEEAAADLESTGRRFILAPNVLPRIGVVEPLGARAAIRQVFLQHVIGGKGLSRGPRFARLVRAATPDAVLGGVEVLAAAAGQDVMVIDVGGATTDVYSVLEPQGEDAGLRKQVVAPLWHARTVEGDLGMRWGALGVIEAARAEGLLGEDAPARELASWAEHVLAEPSVVPADEAGRELDLRLATLAAIIAARRHGRPAGPGEPTRPLADVGLLLGSGGVLRHASAPGARQVLDRVLADHVGGWRAPAQARAGVDTAYLLLAAGLLAPLRPDLAGAVVEPLVAPGTAGYSTGGGVPG